MTAAPYLLEQARNGYRMGHGQLKDSMILDGLWCAMSDVHMGVTAENIATEFEISRQDQDEFSAESQQRAGRAIRDHKFDDEIVVFRSRSGVATGLGCARRVPAASTQADGLAKLRPAFDRPVP